MSAAMAQTDADAYGYWLEDSHWIPDPNISVPPGKQYQYNIDHGFICPLSEKTEKLINEFT